MVDYGVFMANCPHCGAPVTEITCPYCNSLLVDLSEVEEKKIDVIKTGYIVRQSQQTGAFGDYDPVLKGVNRCADDILSCYSKHSDAIYKFMEKNKIGHSEYGKIMDAAAKGKHVMCHRLYGHHPLFDFPFREPTKIPAFAEHLFSDYFTKMGLPIVPGEILNDVGLLKWCDKLTRSWNFVNGFDVLSGTVALAGGVEAFRKCFSQEGDEPTAQNLASQIGIGTFELLIATSTYNPFLLVGALLTVTAGSVGMIKSGARAFAECRGGRLSVSIR